MCYKKERRALKMQLYTIFGLVINTATVNEHRYTRNILKTIGEEGYYLLCGLTDLLYLALAPLSMIRFLSRIFLGVTSITSSSSM